jgi:hypothetical protein
MERLYRASLSAARNCAHIRVDNRATYMSQHGGHEVTDSVKGREALKQAIGQLLAKAAGCQQQNWRRVACGPPRAPRLVLTLEFAMIAMAVAFRRHLAWPARLMTG